MSKPVLFIPGFPGSHLIHHFQDGGQKQIFFDRFLASPLLSGPDALDVDDGVRAGEPIKSLSVLFFEIKQAASLYEVLERIGVRDLVRFGWDWRRPLWDTGQTFSTQDLLETAIRDLHADSGQKVTVIAHSTGGLIARHLFESRPARVLPHVERLISFGVPWAGLLRTLEYLVGKATLPLIDRLRTQEILARSWAAFDLLPPDPTHLQDPVDGEPLHLIYRRQGGCRVDVDPLVDTDWLNALPTDPDLQAPAQQRAAAAASKLRGRTPTIDTQGEPLDVVNVVGWGAETLVEAEVAGSGSATEVSFGRDEGDSDMEGGDGTAPRRSAAWIESRGAVQVRTYHVPIGFLPWPYSRTLPHRAIWRNPGAKDLLSHLLAGKPLSPFIYAAVDENDYSPNGPENVRVRVAALDPDGRPLPEVRMIAGLRNGDASVPWRTQVAGRRLAEIPRSQMRRVGRRRRFTLRFRWRDDGTWRETDEQIFWIF